VADGFGLSRIGQIAMTVDNLPRAVAFYRDVLGMRFLFEAPPAMAFFDCGGVRLMMSLPEEKGAVAGQRFASIVYYTVPDIQAAAAVLGARGVTFEAAPHLVARLPHADLWMGFFRDPEGNVLALMSEVAKSAVLNQT
jgi:methylmalonyl-CoA/ethylmalonyl-CoA epimerase